MYLGFSNKVTTWVRYLKDFRYLSDFFIFFNIINLTNFIIQHHVPVALPCYDFTLVICSFMELTVHCVNQTQRFNQIFKKNKLPACDGRCVQSLKVLFTETWWFPITNDSNFIYAISAYNPNLINLSRLLQLYIIASFCS